MLQKIDHSRVSTDNFEGSKNWYSKIFQTAPVVDEEGYVEFCLESGNGFAIARADSKSPTSSGGTICYWKVENLNDSIKYFESLGASVYRGPLKIDDELSICQIKDPFGGVFGCIGR